MDSYLVTVGGMILELTPSTADRFDATITLPPTSASLKAKTLPEISLIVTALNAVLEEEQ